MQLKADMAKPLYFDTHCHLQLRQYEEDRDELIARMEREGVAALVVGVDYRTSDEAAELAGRHEHLFACVGAHPDTAQKEEFDEERFRALLAHERVVAVGECGLDFSRTKDEAEKGKQRQAFKQQIQLALECDVPLVLHIRPSKGTMDAYEAALLILESYKKENGERLRGIAHFFVGTETIASAFVAIDFLVSFPGIITFAREFDRVVRAVPPAMILAETDAPFAAPEPYRGERNEPSHVKKVVEQIARIRGEDVESVRKSTVQNAIRVFGLQQRF